MPPGSFCLYLFHFRNGCDPLKLRPPGASGCPRGKPAPAAHCVQSPARGVRAHSRRSTLAVAWLRWPEAPPLTPRTLLQPPQAAGGATRQSPRSFLQTSYSDSQSTPDFPEIIQVKPPLSAAPLLSPGRHGTGGQAGARAARDEHADASRRSRGLGGSAAGPRGS